VEKTIREIKESQAEKTATQAVRSEMEKMKSIVADTAKGERRKAKGEKRENETRRGVLHTPNNPDEISFEQKLQQLQDVLNGGIPKKKNKFGSILSDINIRKSKFSPNLDLRGLNAEDATNATLKFLDDAVLFSEKHLQILHGRGDGILRRIVRDILQLNRDVERFNYEHIERGGDGITVVIMK
ncbi:MAG: Smr/MutS family protein, partial [Bacteroidales bacterium]|nr:Smr/MutS family protein [Bacteroidales bacterium]